MSADTARLVSRARDLPPGWWGMLLLIATETTLFGSLIATYFFLRVSQRTWPMDGIRAPEVLTPTLLTAALVATSVPMALSASAAIGGRARRAWWLALLAVAVQCAYLAWQSVLYLDSLRTFKPSRDAYASIYYTLLGTHDLHVLVGILLVAWVLARLLTGRLTPYRVTTVRVVAWYWHFVNAMAVLVLLTQISPSL